MLTPARSTLLDDARAEAKRAGHAGVAPLHLAAVLARRAPEQFEASFGAGAIARLRQRLSTAAPVAGEQETIALLESASSDDPVAVIAALRNSLKDLASENGAAPGGAAPQQAEPTPPPAPSGPPPVDPLIEHVEPDPEIIGFEAAVDELVGLLSMRSPATALVRGASGAGKTSLLAALATRLSQPGYDGPLAGSSVMRIDTATALSEDPVAALDRALDAQREHEIVVVDDLESLLSLGAAATILPMLARLRGAAADPDSRVVLVLDDAYLSRLESVDQELVTICSQVRVPELTVEQLHEIAARQASKLAAHHGVELADSLVRLACAPRASGDRGAHPGLLIERLDRACSRAAMREDRRVTEPDLGLTRSPEVAPLDSRSLVEGLRRRVRGQDEALRVVAARLALTRAELDLRPTRPDGVFLFVGPTGVGKTELARALCEQLYGDEDRLVRLDMSEYAEPWALSRLIGPQPGYVGFTEPETWLTTKIRTQPDTVLLLDEFEKAHPTVWNAFLQVFDAGRLSDARGNVADFSHTVVAMTSNLGGRTFGTAPIGFSPQQDDSARAHQDAGRVLDAVKDAVAPELINRLDEIVVFAPLSREAIEEIARLELDRLRQRLTERGYIVQIGDEVVATIARTGYDPAYGARHLQRNIERLLLEPLAGMTQRELTARVVDGGIVWTPAKSR